MRTTKVPSSAAPPDAAPAAPTPSSSPAPAKRAPATEHSTPSRRWWWMVIAGLVAVGIAGAAWFYLAHRPRDETLLVLQGNIDVRQVNLAFKVDGRIETLAVDEGDTVNAGQVVAGLDKRYFHDDLRAARARRDNA